MQDQHLLVIALCCAVIGVIGVAVSYWQADPPSTLPGEVTCMDDYAPVRVDAQVTDVRHVANITVLTLKQSVDGVVYDTASIREGSHVTVWGHVSTYKGSKQVVIERMQRRE